MGFPPHPRGWFSIVVYRVRCMPVCKRTHLYVTNRTPPVKGELPPIALPVAVDHPGPAPYRIGGGGGGGSVLW